MITINRQDIVGPIKLPGFNGVGDINLENFIGMEIEIPKGYEFESLGSLDLDTEVDELDDIWSNDGVREEGNTEERIQALENNFSIKGFLTNYTPGMGSKDSTGKENPVEGRGRALAGKRNGEKKICCIFVRKLFYFFLSNEGNHTLGICFLCSNEMSGRSSLCIYVGSLLLQKYEREQC